MLNLNRRSAPRRALQTVTGHGRKSALERALETVGSSLDAIGGAAPSVPDVAIGQGPQGRPDRRGKRGGAHGRQRRDLLAAAPDGRRRRGLVIVTKAAIFAAGYLFGTRAGRERYAQILAAAARASQRLEDYSARHPGALLRAVAVALDVAPDGRRRLSEGALVEASVVARLLGVRLLRLHATVALAPAEVRPATAPVRVAASRGLTRAAPPGRRVAPGRRLPDAVRTIDEAADILAGTRRDGV